MSYCIYTAATIVVEDLKDGYPGDRERTDSFLEALECARIACPGIQRSIDIIRRNLTPSMATDPVLNDSYIDVDATIDPSLPTFPYLPLHGLALGDYGMLSSDQACFSALDSFAE
jgi:hypothetical protein